MLYLIVLFFLICVVILLYKKHTLTDYFTPKIILDKIYYINLDRRPDRNEHMLKQFELEQIPYEKVERFRAIDGKSHQFTEEELKLFSGCSFQGAENKHLIMGNQLSHYYILKDVLEKNYNYVLILQDDVVFKKGFNKHLDNVLQNIPKDAEIINIGFHKYAVNEVFEPVELENNQLNKTDCEKEANPYICHWKHWMNPCSLAYIITKKGAKNLVEHFQSVGFKDATDWNYNHYLQSKGVFYGSKTVLCTGALMGSNIFGSST